MNRWNPCAGVLPPPVLLLWRKPMGPMSTRMGGTETGRFWVPIGTGGGVGALPGLVSEGKHPSDPTLSFNPLVGWGWEGYVIPPFCVSQTCWVPSGLSSASVPHPSLLTGRSVTQSLPGKRWSPPLHPWPIILWSPWFPLLYRAVYCWHRPQLPWCLIVGIPLWLAGPIGLALPVCYELGQPSSQHGAGNG